jgi:hypothetical protein
MQRFFLLLLAVVPMALRAQQAQELNVPTPLPIQPWKAQWVTHPALGGSEYAVVLFRRTVEYAQVPARCVVSLSADNHYTLFVNGKQVCFGPQLSDIRHWRYETIDLAPFLKPGRNVIAAEVVNWGADRFFGMQSIRTAFILNGYSPEAEVLNTRGSGAWKTLINPGVRGKEVRWRVVDKDISGGFYAANPTDSLLADRYPWGWPQTDFDDANWQTAKFVEAASNYAGGFAWLLEPRNVPLQTQQAERLARVVRSSGGEVPAGFLPGTQPLTIPARSTVSFLIDHGVLTMGYPELTFSGGRGSTCRITYAENLFTPDKRKGNRNDLTGKTILGIHDVLLPDGSANRTFRPTWLRTFRFLQVDVTTGDEPLVLQGFLNQRTTSPIARRAAFRSNDERLNQLFDVCWRTVELSTQDYWLSDAYYETMQYLGDSKVHALSWYALTGDAQHWRNALKQFDDSRLPDGNLTSCYPLRSTFVHPTYSMIWVDMLYDYLLLRGSEDGFVKQFLPNIRHTLDGLTVLLDSTGLPGRTRWDYFNDWYTEGRRGGLAPGSDSREGHSATVALHYVYALQNAARIYEHFGRATDAAEFRQRAATLQQRARACFFDPKTGLFLENETRFRDQRPNFMAVLTNTIPPAQQRTVLEKLATDTTLSQAGYYYRIYFFEALRKAKAGDLFPAVVKPWMHMLADGLSTTPEFPGVPAHPPRSECHPWSTAPAWAYFSVIAGIEPGEIGFKTIRLEPNLGTLREVEGTYPHPKGDVKFQLEKTGTGLRARVTLPSGLTGTFRYAGQSRVLRAGEQVITL